LRFGHRVEQVLAGTVPISTTSMFAWNRYFRSEQKLVLNPILSPIRRGNFYPQGIAFDESIRIIGFVVVEIFNF